MTTSGARADVTIVTPTRNRPDLLDRALQSILRQTRQSYEVVVVDDGSVEAHTAAYRELVQGLDDRFRLIQPLRPGESGSGPAVSRNRGIDGGTGRYVAFLDDDDTWIWDDYLTASVGVLDETGLDLHCADMEAYRGGTLEFPSWFPDMMPLTSGQRLRDEPPAFRVSRANFVRAAAHRVIHPNMLLVRRTLFERAGGFLNSLRYAEDTELVLRLADHVAEVVFCQKPVARYRLPEGSAHSLTVTAVDQDLQTLAAARHLYVTARSREVRRAAAGIASWTLRRLSHQMRREGRPGASVSLALQALAARPTVGSLVDLGRAVLPAR
jgi:glycosyltransferase involved in cell wall biosynthesis